MTIRARWATVAAALLLTSCQTQFVGGWMPWWQSTADRAEELATIGAAAPLLNEVSPFWYAAHGANIDLLGNGTTLDNTVASLRASGLKVMPSIVDGNGQGVMAGILADPVQRTNHVQQITNLAVGKNYDGVDLDYEVFAFTDGRASWPTTQPNWVAFVAELGASLHANGKLLSVTVPPVWTTASPSGTPTVNGYTVYAQAEIAPHIDRLRLMVYDWSVSSPGPLAPMFWVNSVIAYSSAIVPASKLQLGVPAYGRHWSVKKNPNDLCPDGAVYRDSVTMEQAPRLAASRGVTPQPDKNGWGEMTFWWEQTVTGPRTPTTAPTYTPSATPIGSVNGTGDPNLSPAVRLTPPSNYVSCTVIHVVYYPNATSVRQRADAALAAGWEGIFVWALGYETTDVWQALSNVP